MIRSWKFIVALGLGLTLAGLYARYGVRDNVLPRNFGVVVEGQVYRSGRLTPAATQLVHDRTGFRTVIDLGAYVGKPIDEQVAAKTAQALGVKRINFTDLDGYGVGNPNSYVAALRAMSDPANQPVLVHCAAGAQRTSVCMMLYRKIYQGVPFETSIAEALEHDHDPRDNPHLRVYLQTYAEAIERAVRTGETIPWPDATDATESPATPAATAPITAP
ncbi:MAG: fused DSP-PTPase phosphatase/NAD kinase-like protein [Phycisphaerales bacterium]|jgi:protein tyrosine/serine phosphatase|nr:tyrosine-protein phosphatase [Phycisphaeraceae bacterium]